MQEASLNETTFPLKIPKLFLEMFDIRIETKVIYNMYNTGNYRHVLILVYLNTCSEADLDKNQQVYIYISKSLSEALSCRVCNVGLISILELFPPNGFEDVFNDLND